MVQLLAGILGDLEHVIERVATTQRGRTITTDPLLMNTPETAQQLAPDELENRMSPNEYFISFVKK